ncbi:MAG: hypothetical protein J6W11_03290 [Alphaproteobacteria bacterium]|nr:hypothetical protein [Alphaproteobacteria bacterium]
MKKLIVSALGLTLAGCANYCTGTNCSNSQPQPAVVYEEPAVQVNPCACAYAPKPCREVQHPRIVEEQVVENNKRPCDDHQTLSCGCGYCDTFHPYQPGVIEEAAFGAPQAPETIKYIPAQPKSYELAANRAFNRFIKDTYAIYSKTPNVKIHVDAPIAKDSDLPGGIEKGTEVFRTHLQNSHTFELTDNIEDADYVVKTTAEWFDTESKTVPAIKYIIELTDKDGKQAGIWSQIVKRADNKSWL